MMPIKALRMRTAAAAVVATYTTLSPYYTDTGLALSNGNLTATASAVSGNRTACSRDAKTSGKWYFEVHVDSGSAVVAIGVMTPTGNGVVPSISPSSVGADCWSATVFGNTGNILNNTSGSGGTSSTFVSLSSGFGAGDTVGVEVDIDAGTIKFRKNGGSLTSAVTIAANKPYMPFVVTSGTSTAVTVNFGATSWGTTPTSGYSGWTVNSGYTGRYWRTWQVGNPTRSYTHFDEIELRLSAGGSDQTSGGTASVSGTTAGSAANVYDNNFATAWEHAVAQGWAQYDFGSGVTKAIQEMLLAVRPDFSDYPNGLVVVFSDDASTWMPAYTIAAMEMTRGERRVFTWDPTFSLPVQTTVTWNPSDKSAKYSLSAYNTIATKTTTDAEDSCLRGTKGISAGKRYFECIVVDSSSSAGAQIGIAKSTATLSNYVGSDANGWAVEMSNGNKLNNGAGTAYASGYADGDIWMVAYDAGAGNLWLGKNGVWSASGDPAAGTNPTFSGISGTLYPAAGLYRQFTPTQKVGIRTQTYNQTYAPPSGFSAWGVT